MRKKPKSRFRPQIEVLEARDLPSTFFVAQTSGASDSNAGTSGMPWLTLQHAANSVQPGDTVVVETGDYTGFDLSVGGTKGNPITFEAAPSASVVIDSPEAKRGKDGINLEDVINYTTSVDFVTIQGLTIDNSIKGTITEAGIRAVSSGSFNGTGIILNGNTANDCGEWGIFTSHEDNVLIENNTCSNSQQQHGIYVSNACFNPVVKNNILFGNAGAGLHMNGDASQGPAQEPDGTSDGNNGNIVGALVEDNIIYNNGTKGGSGINGDGVQNSTIENNLLYNNHASGISLFQINAALPATNNIVVNNTIVMASDGRWCVNIQNASTGNTVFNNILLNNNTGHGSISISTDSLPGFVSNDNVVTTNNNAFDQVDSGGNDTFMTFAAWQGATFPGTGQDKNSIAATAAQLFINAGANDYQLVSGSPAIGIGAASLNGHAAPTTDLAGNPRPTPTGYDIGAYQFPSASPPAAPNNLAATASNGQVSLTWTASAGATSYNVYRGTSKGGEGATPITNVSGTTFTDTGLTNGTTYFYEVTALNTNGESGKSNEAQATPQVPAPPAPTNLTAAPGNGQVVLNWTASSGAASYNVYRGTSKGGEGAAPIASNVSGTTFTDTGLSNGSTYFYKISAVNPGGQSGYSNEAQATLAPPAPTHLTAKAGSAQIVLKWTASQGASTYDIYRGTQSGGENATPIASVSGTTFTNTGLTNGTTYFYEVSAVNTGGQSGKSNEASAAPQAWKQTVGIFDPTQTVFHLSNVLGNPGGGDIAFQFGGPGWYPVAGDWNGDGLTTIGVVNLATETWYLRNTNSGGGPDYTPFQFGAPGWIPVVGNWSGTGHTGIGAFNPATGTWYLRNEVGPGGADAGVFQYGGADWIPIAGDFFGLGHDTVGVFDPVNAIFHLSKVLGNPGGADYSFQYGGAGWKPFAGDFSGNGKATIGLFDPTRAVFHVSKVLGNPGAGDIAFQYGGGNWLPIAGDWDFPALPQLAADGEARVVSGSPSLTETQLQGEVQTALNLLAADGVNSTLIARLGSLQFTVGQLPAGYLGLSNLAAGTVEISADAAGYGWFVDANPQDLPTANRMDLLTVVLHEMGHFDGWTELNPTLYPDALMALTLGTGERRIQNLDAVFVAGL